MGEKIDDAKNDFDLKLKSYIYFLKKTVNPYYYLYYKLSCFLNKKGDNRSGPVYVLSFLIGLNILFIYAIISKSFEIELRPNDKHVYAFLILFLCFLYFNKYVFLYKKKDLVIVDHFKNKSLASKKLGTFLVICYIILSIILLFFT